MRRTVILTNFEFSSTIIGKVSHLSGGFSGVRAKCRLAGLTKETRIGAILVDGSSPNQVLTHDARAKGSGQSNWFRNKNSIIKGMKGRTVGTVTIACQTLSGPMPRAKRAARQ